MCALLTFPVTIDAFPASVRLRRSKTLFDLQSGKIDLIVGTHKLLQKDSFTIFAHRRRGAALRRDA